MPTLDPRLVAHRGQPLQIPENSLTGFEAALEAGAQWVETDVQITADRVPVLCHDPSTLRVTGVDYQVVDTTFDVISRLSAGYPKRFADAFSQLRIAPLSTFAQLVAQWPSAHAFVEIKLEAIEAFGEQETVRLVVDALKPAIGQCIIISFDFSTLRYVRGETSLPIGFILTEWSDAERQRCLDLRPDYIFVNHLRLEEGTPLWQGNWKWVAYTANEPPLIRQLLTSGFHLVETDEIRRVAEQLGATDSR